MAPEPRPERRAAPAGARVHGPDRARLKRTLAEFVALGSRFPGTPGEARARSWLLQAFADLGLDSVHEEPFTYLAYEGVSASCSLAAGGAFAPCVGLQSTCDGAVEADGIYLGRGSAADLEACRRADCDLDGKVAIVHGGLIHTVVPRLLEQGAAAIVNIGEVEGGFAGHFTATFYPPPAAPPWEGRVLDVPGVTLEAEAGLALLRELAAGHRRLRVEHRAVYRPRETANVVGRRFGSEGGLAEVVVGAHYDSQRESPGAADNASGIAALLEIARGLGEPARGVAVVAFAAEELASWGAYAYVLDHLHDQPGMVAMVNLDALGAPLDATRTIVADTALAATAIACAREVGWEAEAVVEARDFPYADHIPFVDAGIPACWIWRYPPNHPYYHSPGDQLRYVDPGRLLEDTRAAAAAVHQFVLSDFAPGPVRPTERTAALARAAAHGPSRP